MFRWNISLSTNLLFMKSDLYPNLKKPASTRSSIIPSINYFDLFPKIDQDNVKAMGLFPNYAMMNHDCIHNTKTFVEMENGCFKLRVIATQIITPGNNGILILIRWWANNFFFLWWSAIISPFASHFLTKNLILI